MMTNLFGKVHKNALDVNNTAQFVVWSYRFCKSSMLLNEKDSSMMQNSRFFSLAGGTMQFIRAKIDVAPLQ